ncbi:MULTISPECIES: PopZ family protein [unclassified Xanthobacter]|uniref:PopZ family protein n=1 Tax=unclassified Xanthobacter TaxID=2623496 RepID=UPI001EDE72C1
MAAPDETPGVPLPRRDLLSPAVDAAVSAAFRSLGDLVLPQQERTIEDLVKEILRPMLKAWLDENLSGIVERAVRAEIERVTSNRR